MPQATATCSRSVPVPVWLIWFPVCPQASLSYTTTMRFLGISRAMVPNEPRFISSEPSPSSAITCSSVAKAMPRAREETKPMLP